MNYKSMGEKYWEDEYQKAKAYCDKKLERARADKAEHIHNKKEAEIEDKKYMETEHYKKMTAIKKEKWDALTSNEQLQILLRGYGDYMRPDMKAEILQDFGVRPNKEESQ